MRRRTWAWMGGGAFTAALAAGVAYLAMIAPSGTGYKALTACSAVFISGRDPASLDAAEFAGLHPILAYIHPEVARSRREVRASLFGLGAQKAVFRPGLGCTLADTDAVLPAPPALLRTPLPRSTDAISRGVQSLPPGVDAARLAAAVDAAFADPDPQHPRRTRALLVLHDGRLIIERYAPGFTYDMPLAGYSMTKTMTGALAGILAARGLVRVDAPANVPQWRDAGDPRGRITVEQLLHMTTGMHWSEAVGDPLSPILKMTYHARDAAGYAAGLPLDHPPGTVFTYNSGSSNILALVLRRAMRDDAAYLALPRTAIFAPAGMASATIAPDASGTLLGHAQGFATARDWLRFGELFLADGTKDGVQVLPKGWVARAARTMPASAKRGYGAHVWVNRPYVENGQRRLPRPSLPEDAMLMNGQFGQLTAVIPSRRVVIVRLGDTRDWDCGADPDKLVASILAALPG